MKVGDHFSFASRRAASRVRMLSESVRICRCLFLDPERTTPLRCSFWTGVLSLRRDMPCLLRALPNHTDSGHNNQFTHPAESMFYAGTAGKEAEPYSPVRRRHVTCPRREVWSLQPHGQGARVPRVNSLPGLVAHSTRFCCGSRSRKGSKGIPFHWAPNYIASGRKLATLIPDMLQGTQALLRTSGRRTSRRQRSLLPKNAL